MSESDKCCKVLWAVSRLQKIYRNASSSIYSYKEIQKYFIKFSRAFSTLKWPPQSSDIKKKKTQTKLNPFYFLTFLLPVQTNAHMQLYEGFEHMPHPYSLLPEANVGSGEVAPCFCILKRGGTKKRKSEKWWTADNDSKAYNNW